MKGNRKIWLNGKITSWDQATVHLMSHGFSRGVAIFEVFSTHLTAEGTCAFRMDMSMRRLTRSVELLGVKLKYSIDEITKAVVEVVQANQMGNNCIKIYAYDATESFTNLVPDCNLDVCVFGIDAEPILDKRTICSKSACFSFWNKIHPGCVPVEAKVSANYLNGMMSRQEANNRGFDVGIMLDTHGFVAESATESLFMVKDGILSTAPLGRVLAGISRDSVLQIARSLEIPTQERAFYPSELLKADEIFTSNTMSKVRPIHRIENTSLPTVTGPISLKLIDTLEQICSGQNTQFKTWLTPLN